MLRLWVAAKYKHVSGKRFCMDTGQNLSAARRHYRQNLLNDRITFKVQKTVFEKLVVETGSVNQLELSLHVKEPLYAQRGAVGVVLRKIAVESSAQQRRLSHAFGSQQQNALVLDFRARQRVSSFGIGVQIGVQICLGHRANAARGSPSAADILIFDDGFGFVAPLRDRRGCRAGSTRRRCTMSDQKKKTASSSSGDSDARIEPSDAKCSEKETTAARADDDRVMQDVVAPPRSRLTRGQLLPGGASVPDLAVLRAHLIREGRIEEKLFLEIIEQATRIFRAEPNVLELKAPITVCGDIHGQFFDLDRLFGDEYGGKPREASYLFLGDYVDRGCFSTEVVAFLFCHKIVYKNRFHMLRGNHECRQLTAHFNFKDECLYKYSETVYNAVMNSFDCLPLAAVIHSGQNETAQSFFCVHGGLSPDITTIEDIDSISRYKETPRDGPMCDLLWSDPFDEEKGGPTDDSDEEADSDEALETEWFSHNETRQCSYKYGHEAVKQFLEENNVTSVIRAHEAQHEGFKIHMQKGGAAPKVITIFSAPNYCDVFHNKGAILRLSEGALGIKQFREVPHPYYLPNFMDVFEWSLPFVAEKVTDMLQSVLEPDDDDVDHVSSEAERRIRARGGMLRKKVRAVGRVLRLLKLLRRHKKLLSALKRLTPNHELPIGVLHSGFDGIKRALIGFDTANKRQTPNEPTPSPKLIPKKERRRSRRFSRTSRTSVGSHASHSRRRSSVIKIDFVGLREESKNPIQPAAPVPEGVDVDSMSDGVTRAQDSVASITAVADMSLSEE